MDLWQVTKKQRHDLKDDAIKAVLFVFLLLAIAEVAAPYFHVSFEDPLLLAGFVTGIIGNLLKPKEKTKPHLLIVKESDIPEIVDRLSPHANISGISVASSPEHAEKILAEIKNPSDAGVLLKIQEVFKTK